MDRSLDLSKLSFNDLGYMLQDFLDELDRRNGQDIESETDTAIGNAAQYIDLAQSLLWEIEE